jgi:hypothetical protein
MVRVMKSRMYAVLFASLGAMALTLAGDESLAGSKAGSRAGIGSTSHRLGAHMSRFHRRALAAFVWPGDEGFGFGPNGGPIFDGTSQVPADVRNSNANDIPWDWIHRYPPMVAPSARPYVSSCGAETVTVPDGHGGNGQVNIFRCY